MSGICGIFQPGRLFSQGSLHPMLAGLTVGPGETREALWGDSIALGAAKGFAGQDASAVSEVWAVADSDLLNLDQLRSAVEAKGQPVPSSAAGLLAALYALYGDDFVHKLDGAFAFALWDARARRLVLAIDRLGIKNIYWRFEKGNLDFATRIGAIRALDPDLELNRAALAQFLLFSAIPAPMSIYDGAEKMRPGFMLVLEHGQVRLNRYWDVEYHEERRPESEWAALIHVGLRASVHRHLHEARPETTGAFLSGGTDSSTVVAFMSERQHPVRTFSAVFNESSYSEESFVRTISERFRTDQHDCRLTPQDVMDAIPLISRYYDEPFANSSAIAAYHCCMMARRAGVNLLLGGDGGDELFAGNERYATDKHFALYQRIPHVLRRFLIEPGVGFFNGEHKWLGLPGRYVKRARIPNPRRFFSYNFFLSFPEQQVFAADFLEDVPRENWLTIPESHFAQPSNASELNRLLYVDLKMTLADNDLKKVSGMAELAGIQVRYPLLDYPLAELAGRVPVKLKLRGFEKRYIFKRAMRDVLPDKVLYKKKHGMGVPVSAWLLNDAQLRAFAHDLLHDSRTRQRGYFAPGFFDSLLNLQRHEHVGYYGEIIWYLVALELWHREHLDHPARLICAG